MTEPVVVCALYRFVSFTDYRDWQSPLLTLMQEHGVRGTLLLAHEGINGTIAGPRTGVDAVLDRLRGDTRFAALECKEAIAEQMPFSRSRVKLKKEIVTMGVADIDPAQHAGEYVEPAHWNALITDPDVVVIDTRNHYEVEIGSFKGAINPQTETFREFPGYAQEHLQEYRGKKVAMFCTGGIRCEKSTAYLRQQGVEEVYHLRGGILKYLEDVPAEDSMWQGECFVFDDRVTVDHNLAPGQYDQCHACRMPISAEDKKSNAYVKGVSCHHCIDKISEQQKARFREREHQVRLAAARGESHIGADAAEAQARHRETKQAERQQQRAQQQKKE